MDNDSPSSQQPADDVRAEPSDQDRAEPAAGASDASAAEADTGQGRALAPTPIRIEGLRTRRGGILLLIAGVILLLWLLGPVLTPFVCGAGLAYVCDPLVDRLERWRLSRTAGVVVVFAGLLLVFTLTMVLLFPLLQQQANTFIRNLPRYVDWLQRTVVPYFGGLAPGGHLDVDAIRDMISENWGTAGSFASTVAKRAFSSGTALLAIAMNLLLVPVIMFYLLRDWDHMVAWIRSQLPRRYIDTADELAAETDQVLGQFIRGQLLVMAALGTIYVVGLWLAGLELALIIGLGAGIVSFVPYVGVISGLAVSTIAMLVQTGDPFQLLWVFLVFGLAQIMEQAVLQPLLIGDFIGLHPVWVIFAVLAGGSLFGFIGVLLALPVAAAVAVLVRYGGRQWRSSRMYLDH